VVQGDLFFLRDALAHGMSPAEVARFLRRTEDEVRERGKGMPRKRTRSSPRGEEADPSGKATIRCLVASACTLLMPGITSYSNATSPLRGDR
jgi:hypothetical protein